MGVAQPTKKEYITKILKIHKHVVSVAMDDAVHGEVIFINFWECLSVVMECG